MLLVEIIMLSGVQLLDQLLGNQMKKNGDVTYWLFEPVEMAVNDIFVEPSLRCHRFTNLVPGRQQVLVSRLQRFKRDVAVLNCRGGNMRGQVLVLETVLVNQKMDLKRAH